MVAMWFPRFPKKKIQGRRIAVCLGDGCGLGNMLQALPAVQALYEQGNICDLFLSGFAYEGIADVVRGQPYVRDVYENTYENRERRYDFCIVSFLSGHRVNNADAYLQLRKDWNRRSEYEEYCRAARKLGAASFHPPRLNVADRNFHLPRGSVLLHAGCTNRPYWERRKWNHYGELVAMLAAEGIPVYCCGSADEAIDHPQVISYLSLPISETAALIQQCDLFVSNDSGLMHLAAALRKRQIAIFTATSDKKSGPYYNPLACVLTPKLACYPCYGKGQVWDRCLDWKCRDAVTVSAVYGEIKRIMHFTVAVALQ